MSEAATIEMTAEPTPETPVASVPKRSGPGQRWQIPFAIAAAFVLGSGLLHIVTSSHPISFEEQLLTATRLRQANRLTEAAGYLKELLSEEGRSNAQRAELHAALAGTIHQVEARLTKHSPANAGAILSNLEQAMRLHRMPTCDDWVTAADAHAWKQQEDEAVEALRRAIAAGSHRGTALRKRIVELRSGAEGALSDEAVGELDAILGDSGAHEADFGWAAERKVEWLLDQGKNGDAAELVRTARSRVTGGDCDDLLDYLEARGLVEAGESASAARLLMAVRDRRASRDEIWAKAGWLLGTIEQRDERPQAALSFFEDVLSSYERGEMQEACALGRAECLAALERHDEALEAFRGLRSTVRDIRNNRHLSVSAIRSALAAAGQGLTQRPDATAEDVAAGIAYLRQAMEWVGPADRMAQLPIMEKVGDALRGLARQEERADAKQPDRVKAARLHEEAAEAYVNLSRMQNADDAAAALAVWNAVEEYGAAGRRGRVIELLERFVGERPSSGLRSRALHELGEAYQAEGRFGEAIKTYDAVVAEFLPLPNALASMVPLAQCLIQEGGASAARGVKILVDIVDDRGPRPFFTPQASEYRQALFLLARYYLRADDRTEPRRLERAIERLDDAKALYPGDPQASELTFHLGDSYRLSALALRKGASENATSRPGAAPAEVSAATRAEADRRLEAALRNYTEVIVLLAGRDESKLSGVERAYLKLSYVYRGDCLFDLMRYREAQEAYEEAAWRYANAPTCISASMQIYHCHLRVGRVDDARATLGRLKWLLATIPEETFVAEQGMPGKVYWHDMVARLEQLGEAGAQQ